MKYLITGISGTLGQAVLKVLPQHDQIIGLSRDECKQAALEKPPNLTLYLGDVRDRRRLLEASRGCDAIFHFAALKHVDILEANPEEGIATDISGTANVLHAQRILGIPRVILSSTDKAAYPINLYGMCKGVAEKLTLRNSNNVVCRYGNVAASRGSAIPNFVKTLKEQNTVFITDPNMTRFWIRIEDAAQFVASQLSAREGGLKIPPMKGSTVEAVVIAIAEILKISSYQTKYVGIRPGEKLHETLRMEHEGELLQSNTCPRYTHSELIDLLSPIVAGLR